MNRIVVMLLTVFFCFDLHASTPNPYPNEINGLKFYDRYISPLRPGQSHIKDVIQVIGLNSELQLDRWKIGALYACDDDPIVCSGGSGIDRLAEIVVTPKHRVSFRHRMFPLIFDHSYGTVSEINVICDIYKDSFGLEYWAVSKNGSSYKKGDLLWVQYGAPHPIVPQIVTSETPIGKGSN